MEHAISMRYAGALIEAKNCDHKSYRTLGLVCPFCGNGVYLVEGHERVEHFRKGRRIKGSKVGNHFSHYPAAGDEQIKACEARAQTLTPRQVQSMASRGQNQRLKIFQRQMLRMLKTSCLIGGTWDNTNAIAEHLEASIDPYMVKDEVRLELRSRAEQLIDAFEGAIASGYSTGLHLDKYREEYIKLIDGGWELMKDEPSFVWQVPTITAIKDVPIEYHLGVCDEAMRFICGRRQLGLRRTLAAVSLHTYLSQTARIEMGEAVERFQETGNGYKFGFIDNKVTEETAMPYYFACYADLFNDFFTAAEGDDAKLKEGANLVVLQVVKAILGVDWAGQFENVETRLNKVAS